MNNYKNNRKAYRLTNKIFIEKSKENFGENKFDYSLVEYKNNNSLIKLRCIEHDYVFEIMAKSHTPEKTSTGGCPICPGAKKITTEQFIIRAKLVHGDKFDYSDTVFTRFRDKITVRCIEHNKIWEQGAQSHIIGRNPCQDCTGQGSMNFEEFVRRAQEKHGDQFDYSLVVHTKSVHEKVTIICKKHNVLFSQFLRSHYKGKLGCYKCSPVAKMTAERMTEKTNAIYGDGKFDYSVTDFNISVRDNNNNIKCIEHNSIFQQSLDGHASGRIGCKSCRPVQTSKGEEALADFIVGLGFEVERHNRKLLKGKEIDVFVPDKNIGFEYNGIYFHSEKMRPENRQLHKLKYDLATEAGIKLIQVWQDDWRDRRAIVEDHVRHVLGVNNGNRVFARQTSVGHVSSSLAREFLDACHIQGFVSGSVYLGLFDKNYEPGVGQNILVDSIVSADSGYVVSGVEDAVLASNIVGVGDEGGVFGSAVDGDNKVDVVLEHTDPSVGNFDFGGLVAVAVFTKSGGDFVLARYATTGTVVGGHSKLVKFFERNYRFGRLITFADLCFGVGELYESTGWIKDKILAPDYSYVAGDGGSRLHKFGFRKSSFERRSDLLFEPGLTESELAVLNGLYRVWDAGKIRFVKSHPHSLAGKPEYSM